jgi:hypothetical protein
MNFKQLKNQFFKNCTKQVTIDFTKSKKSLFFLLVLLSVSLVSFAQTPIKILAVGNSFSRDAIEQNLHELAAADGYKSIIGNLYIGGCPIERHVNNARNDAPAYQYRKIGVDGKMTEINKEKLSKALEEEDWDYVSVQQASHFSGIDSTYKLLPELVAYIHKYAPKAKIVFHQTWAYAKTSTHEGFKNYGRNQMTMYNAIMKCSKRAVKDCHLSFIIPCGTAIQNARTSFIGDNLNRDGFHLELLVGRYIAACTWFEKIFKHSVIGNSYAPNGMTEEQKAVAQKAAHNAVKHPYKITDMSK